jgi:hypothetical protein
MTQQGTTIEMVNLTVLDAASVERVCAAVDSRDGLDAEELLYYMRRITKELSHLVEMDFVTFWAHIATCPAYVEFLDDYLGNMRKFNDLAKVQQEVSIDDSRLSLLSQDDNELGLLRKQLNRQLKSILQIYFRLSRSMESDGEYFGIDLYRQLVEEHAVFDAAKLVDLAAIYGKTNADVVKRVAEAAVDADPRLLDDLREAFDMAVTVLKRVFKDALRADQLILGEAIEQRSKAEQLEVIRVLQHDLIEILTNFELMTAHLGGSVLEYAADKNFLVYLTNVYCMNRRIRK